MPALQRDLRQLLVNELEAEKDAELALGSRNIGDLVSRGDALWACVEDDASGNPCARLEQPTARVRAGDYLRVVAAAQSDEKESLHRLLARAARARSWDSSPPRAGYRCLEREDDLLRVDRRLPAPPGDRVLILDPEPLYEVFQVLYARADSILAAPIVTAVTTAPPAPWAPEWMSFDTALDKVSHTAASVRVIQGPPGCGKTRLIAQLALSRQRRGESVLAVAFTHRALRQIANAHAALKAPSDSAPWYRERNPAAVPEGCRRRADVPPGQACRGTTLLATATAVALAWKEAPPGGWDLVVVDEASQLALPMILAATALGKEAIVVGDPHQLPPVVKSQTASSLDVADGLTWLSQRVREPIGIREIRRLNGPLCAFASEHFYDGHLEAVPAARGGNCENILPLGDWKYGGDLPANAGAALLLHAGDPGAEAQLVAAMLRALDDQLDGISCFSKAPLRYAVATPRREHVARLRAAFRPHSDLLRRTIIETVDRLQGETVDVGVFSAGESGPTPVGATRDLSWTLSARRLNVALTRARFLSVVVASERYAEAAAGDGNDDRRSRRAWEHLLERKAGGVNGAHPTESVHT